jgi:hypothetical protein
MNYGDDLACIFGCCPIIRRQCKELIWAGCKVAAWPVPLTAFHYHKQTTRLTRVFCFGVL